MASISTISVWDDDAATIAETYWPVSVVSGLATWSKAGNTAAGDRVITQSYSARSASRPTDKIRVKLSFPKEVLVDGVYVVDSVAIADIQVTVPESFTDVDREYFMNNIMDLTLVTKPLHKAVDSREHVYG
jgi:hypothetical protein